MIARASCLAALLASASPASAAETTCHVKVVKLVGTDPPIFDQRVSATDTVPKNVVYSWGRNEIEVAFSFKGPMITWNDGSPPGSGYYSGTYGRRFFIHDQKAGIAVQVECD